VHRQETILYLILLVRQLKAINTVSDLIGTQIERLSSNESDICNWLFCVVL